MSSLSGDRVSIKRRRLHEDVIEHLESAITSGELKPGDRLPSERELMAHFGVGRPSIREAWVALRRMGLISMKVGEGARVVTPTPSSLVSELSGVVRHLLAAPGGMRSLQQARALFESAIAEHAARNATKEDVDALQAALQANQKAANDWELFSRTDVQFHFVIAQIACNPVITALHEGLAEWLAEQRSISIHTPGSIAAAVAAHAEIFDAIAAHDPPRAADAMRNHLGQVEQSYWAHKNQTE